MPVAPKRIKELVEKYKLNYNRYKEYKEEEIKQEFINPFFEALERNISALDFNTSTIPIIETLPECKSAYCYLTIDGDAK